MSVDVKGIERRKKDPKNEVGIVHYIGKYFILANECNLQDVNATTILLPLQFSRENTS